MTKARHASLVAELPDIPTLLCAVKGLRKLGYTGLEAYTPFPVEGLAEALELPRSRLPLAMLLGGVCGGGLTLALQYYSAVIAYPIDSGGRPNASWPAFVPAALEMAILWAVVAGVVGMLAGNGLPRLRHPLFDVAGFGAASSDGLFVLVNSTDPHFELQRAQRDLTDLGGRNIMQVST